MKALTLAVLALALAPAPALAHGSSKHYRPPASSLRTLGSCLRFGYQWIVELEPGGERYCERIGPRKEHPVMLELTIAL